MDNYHIIVVDDDVLNLTAARNILRESGMRVTALRSGRELLTFIVNNSPDLILLDVMMPEMDGFETLRELRILEKAQGRRETPVIFLTGNEDREAEKKGLTLGASDFIRKPFDRDIVISRIRNTVDNIRTIDALTDKSVIDKLTGFVNKANAEERLGNLCQNENGALLVLDLDNFKLVNDLYGHDMGDQVLISFSDILRHSTRSGDVICRIGGDEFCAFLKGAYDNNGVQTFSERLNGELASACRKLMGDDMDIPIGISIGAVFVPEFGREYQELFKLADKAMYLIKRHGKHGSWVYSEDSETDNTDEDDLAKLMVRISCVMDERNETAAPLIVDGDAFKSIYRYIIRFRKRYGGIVVKLLYSLEGLNEESDITVFVDEFETMLKDNLRRSDIIMKYGTNRFFLLMSEQNYDDARFIAARISENWINIPEHEKVTLEYTIDQIVFDNDH